jgi:hypothetical protein
MGRCKVAARPTFSIRIITLLPLPVVNYLVFMKPPSRDGPTLPGKGMRRYLYFTVHEYLLAPPGASVGLFEC